MSNGGKSGSSHKSVNYYGTIAGGFSWRYDWLTGLVSNGNYVWQCPSSGALDLTAPGVVNGSGYVDLTGGLLDPSLIMEGGYLHFYPGVPYAVADPAMPNNPAFRSRAGIVAKYIFLGQESGTAPNIQAIGGAKPVVPTTIVASADNVVDDRQVNPVAALAEYFLDERGVSIPETMFDAPSWLAAAHWCAQDQAHRDFSFVSPLINENMAVRDVVRALLDPISGFLRWTKDGKLGCFIYEWGVNPGGLLTLDARHWTRTPRFTDADWQSIPTEYLIKFTDRAYEFQENTVRVPNQRAAQIRGVVDEATIDDKHVTRAAQAQKRGVDKMRRAALSTGQLYVRGPVVVDLQPGDKVLVDVDPEPGGDGLAQLARIDKVQTDSSDETVLSVTLDPILPATAYTPAWVSPLPESLFAGAVESAPSLVHFLAIPLPLDFAGWPPAVGFLATRPSPKIIGFHAYFTTDPVTPFAELGTQYAFSARCQLVNPITNASGVARLQLSDGATGPDAYVAADTPGGNVAKAEDDYLLAVFVSLDGSGRVALDGAGQPIMEFASILQRSAVTADTHNYTIYRGRSGTKARAWAAAAIVWIIPSASLHAFPHALFESMFGATSYFRLASMTSAAVDESATLPETDMVWPSIPTPDNLVATNGTGKAVSLNWLGSSVFSDSGEYGVFRATGPGFTDWTKIGEVRATRFNDHEVALGVTYQYKIVAITENEIASAYSNVVTITVPSVLASDVDQTPPNDPSAPTLVGSGAYVGDDGTVRSYLMIRVQPLPGAGGGKVKAVEQDVYYRFAGTGSAGWTLQDQPTNPTATEDVRIDDLPPNTSVDVIVIAYSAFSIPSAAIAATGSPFTTPRKTALPTAPTGLTVIAGNDAAYDGPQIMMSGVRASCLKVKWTQIADRDRANYEWRGGLRTDLGFSPPSSSLDGTPVTKPELFFGALVNFHIVALYVRSVDTSGNKSAWVESPVLETYYAKVAGSLTEQNSDDAHLSGVKTGSALAGSVRQVLARAPFDIIPTLVGGYAEEPVNVSLTDWGFNTKPDETTGAINVSSDAGLKCRYDWDDPANSATNAVLKVSTVAVGGTTPGTAVRLQGEFVEHF
jgi:hypothetical protein